MTRFRRAQLAHVAQSFPPCDRGREALERSSMVRELSPRFCREMAERIRHEPLDLVHVGSIPTLPAIGSSFSGQDF